MNKITICDRTIRQLSAARDYSLSFREKIEVAKLLDKLGVDVIELYELRQSQIDSLLIKSIVTAVDNSCIAVPVTPGNTADETVAALKECKNYRLQVEAPVSSVRMEYVCGKKPAKLLESVIATIESCKKYTDNVEFIADDATRGDRPFLYETINAVIDAGVNYITLSDIAGNMLPEEFVNFIDEVVENVPRLKDIHWGVAVADELSMADACSLVALTHGAIEVKASAFPVNTASLPNLSKVISSRGDSIGLSVGIKVNTMKKIISTIEWLCTNDETDSFRGASENDTNTADSELSSNESKENIEKLSRKLGYELSSEDIDKIYEEYLKIANKKQTMSIKELDAIIANCALQVPATYKLEGYIANTGYDITSMVHVKLNAKGEIKEGISLGDGPIDAAFHAIEQITGRHFELDGFGIRAITEGKEATGETVVKLRNNGKLYSGIGLSTDIIGASIKAYVSAVNKIIYEEEEA